MKIAVTGSTGHIGHNLCKKLLAQGHQLKLLVRGNERPFVGENVDYVKGDLLDADSVKRLMIEVDYVYHLAAKIAVHGEDEKSVYDVNVGGVKNVLEAFKDSGAKRLIHFSSIHAYQQLPREEVLNESRPLVTDNAPVYDRTKAEGQRLVQSYVKEHNLDVIILNPTGVFGPEDPYGSLTGNAIKDFYYGKIPVVMNFGFNWVDVRDVVDAAVSAMTKGLSGESHLLAGKYVNMKDKATIIKSFGGKKRFRFQMPLWVMTALLPFIKMGSKISGKPPLFTKDVIQALREGNIKISAERAEKELGFNSRPYEKSIEDLLRYFDSVKS